MTNRVISTLMWVLGALDVVNGIAMFFAPGAWFFQLVPGVPETGSFNAHLVQDSGTFFLAVGIGLIAGAPDPARNAIVVLVAAIASAMHSILHIYSHAAGLLSMQHMGTEAFGIYLPTIVLIAMTVMLLWRPREVVMAHPKTA